MTIEFITRTNCSLCEKGRRVLDRVATRHAVTIVERDVDAEAELAGFSERVPVVRVAGSGRVLDEGQLSSARLAAALRELTG